MTDTSITCPRCRRTSYHPSDVAERYCGACGMWHVDMAETSLLPESTDLELAAVSLRHRARGMRADVIAGEPADERASRMSTASSLDLVADWLRRAAARGAR